MIKLLAVDMDGTCLSDKQVISEQTLSALREAAEAGITVVPTTGRTCTCLPHQLWEETFYRYVISSNGAVATDLTTKECLHRALIPWESVVDLLKECDEHKIGLSVHLDHRFILQGRFLKKLGQWSYGRDARNTECEKSIVELLEREKTDLEELQLFYFRDASRKACREILSRAENLAMAFDSHYVEVYSPLASKGNALRALGEHLGVRQEEIACIGDGENDLSMFAASGMKFAMGNGIPVLREKADVVLPGNNDDGVAHAVRDYILK